MEPSNNTTVGLFPITKHALEAMMMLVEQYNHRVDVPVWIDIVFEAVEVDGQSAVACCHVDRMEAGEWFENANKLNREHRGEPFFGGQEMVDISAMNSDHIRVVLVTECDKTDEIAYSLGGFHIFKNKWTTSTTARLITLVCNLHPQLSRCLEGD